ncbi:MAG TPA: PspC domain-containing protein [Bacillota bacterium]|jgi:phage shock protein C|nr:PspC domain-containing protein [Bacillota bacterium]HOL09157.1 PspC domain-containing protein [Bacillota bacterium]HPO96832.1 PspC domain-containing protein [Bacillota bacterium]
MKRLFRSRQNAIIGGVCGGIGEYFNIDPTIIRILFVLLTGAGILPYLILWIILPYQDQKSSDPAETIRAGAAEIGEKARNLSETIRNNRPDSQHTGLLLGLGLIVIGSLILLRNLGFIWFEWINLRNLWPLLLIAFGVSLLINRKK